MSTEKAKELIESFKNAFAELKSAGVQTGDAAHLASGLVGSAFQPDITANLEKTQEIQAQHLELNRQQGAVNERVAALQERNASFIESIAASLKVIADNMEIS